jgi:hypothetical protein
MVVEVILGWKLMESIISVLGVPIRVTEERWMHIIEEHSELSGHFYDILDAIQNPDSVYQGHYFEHLAVKKVAERKFIVAIYRVIDAEDGFLITAFMTNRTNWFGKRKRLWPLEK